MRTRLLDLGSGSGMEKNPDPGWKRIRIRDGKKSGSEKNPDQGGTEYSEKPSRIRTTASG
jgi:hypothetical protein